MPTEDFNETDSKPITVETTVADAGPWAKTLGVTVPGDAVSKEFDAVIGEIANSIRLPGFRPGKVPRNLVEKRFGDDIRKQVTGNLLRRAMHSAMLKEKLDVVGEPSLGKSDAGLIAEKGKPFVFSLEVEVKPSFELSNYKGLAVEQEEVELLPEEIDEALKRIRDRFAEPVDAPEGHAMGNRDVAKGEMRVVAGGNEVLKEESELLLMDGHVMGTYAHLEAKYLEGAKAGEKRTVESALNERFPVAEQRGKTATLEFEIKSIRSIKLPELSDELAQKMGMKTLDDLKERMRSSLLENVGNEIRQKTQYDLLDRVVAATSFELPKRLQETMSQHTSDQSLAYLQRLGLDPSALGEHRSKVEADAKERAATEMRRYFVIDAICAKEGITVNDEDIDEEIVKRARANGMRASDLYDRMIQEGSLHQMESELKLRKALEFLCEQADIKIVPRKPRKKAHEHGPECGPECGHEEKSAPAEEKKQ